MNILGLSGALDHDASAALVVDGEVVAAAEEERFLRDKHARKKLPEYAARYCLEEAGIAASDIDVVAYPYAPISLASRARWHYAARHWYAPDRALDALFNGNRRYRRKRADVLKFGDRLGINWQRTEFAPVEHHLAHASSAFHLSGFCGKTAILGVDGKGEYATTWFGWGDEQGIHRIAELFDPDSLGGVYGALTEFLGFDMLDGEFKVMGMAPYGDADRFDLSRLIEKVPGGVRVNTQYVNTVGLRRFKRAGRGFYFSPKLIEWLGEPRTGDVADEPYIHIAASLQRLFEERVLELIDEHLGAVLAETGQLAYAGGAALNVKLNQRIIARDDVDTLWVQPAAGDSGTALGAATLVASHRGEVIKPMSHAYLGPAFDSMACQRAITEAGAAVVASRMEDVVAQTADLLAEGHPVAWFSGRMEFGPRALGGRSILGCPNAPGIADRINEQIKFRERWRPFCPSIADSVAPDMLGSEHPSPFMTFTFDVQPQWRERVPEVVHEDGTARVQIVEPHQHPRYYALLERVGELTGNPVLLNTSLNRRGEPLVCSPEDALVMFLACDLEYLVLEDWLVTKSGQDAVSAKVVA
ncbi:MAG: carbamoyltransferase [Pseudomonadaceae bacterium]|nr:carbamoyltransferase [Pseudomonadaceae bacterium]